MISKITDLIIKFAFDKTLKIRVFDCSNIENLDLTTFQNGVIF